MSETAKIRRLSAAYCLRPSQFAQKQKLDSVLRDVAHSALEAALGQLSCSGEVVCIRRLKVPVRLCLSRGDWDLAAEWARVLAQAIEGAISDSADTVRFPSRRLALVEMGCDVALGRLQNVWAWRQIGFWSGRDTDSDLNRAASEFASALCREPEAAVAVLAALAQRGHLRALTGHLRDPWPAIAVAVLSASGELQLSEFSAQAATTDGLDEPWPRESSAPSLAHQRARRIIERSAILRDLLPMRLSEEDVRPVAVLATLECEPSLATKGSQSLIETARLVYAMARLSWKARTLHSRVPANSVDARPLDVLQSSTPDSRFLRGDDAQLSGDDPQISRSTDLRRQGSTLFGGVLYLLHLVEELRLPERALQASALEQRSLPWFLHRLTLASHPMPPGDPAALAFCGLPPGSAHPSWQQPEPTSAEQELIDALAAEVLTRLAEYLPQFAKAQEEIVSFVCCRPARIVADPGWIEAHFSLDDVSLEVRRAGLDLDLNYLPWLGVVVRFAYE